MLEKALSSESAAHPIYGVLEKRSSGAFDTEVGRSNFAQKFFLDNKNIPV